MRTDIVSTPAPGHVNEDFAAATSSAAVLLDGAGLAGVDDGGCRHGVAWYVNHLGGRLITALTDADWTPLDEILAAAIDGVADSHRSTCDLNHPGTPSATVILTRVDDGRVDYLVLADSVLVLTTSNQPAEPDVVCDRREAEVGRRHRAAMDSLPSGTSEHAAAHTAYVATMRAHRNQPGGFWVAAADPVAAGHALTGHRDLAALTAVVLFSDGASRPADRFDLLSWAQLTSLAATGGQQVIDTVRQAEHCDPDGKRWPRGKVHDDATVIYCDRLQ